ncbi:MAG: SDR family oxidoreductase [Haliea sp.]
MSRVLVVGATGDQGLVQVEQLRAAGHAVVAASRQVDGHPFPPGVESRQMDLLRPEMLPGALADIDTVFLNLPSASFTDPAVILRGFDHLLHAAENSDLQRIVFNTSLYVGDSPVGHVAHDTRHTIIERLLASKVVSTIVCPVIFMENMLRGWALPALQERQVLSYPHADELPVSWISLVDVARIMICLAHQPDAENRRFVVGGPQALRGRDTAAALSAAWGMEIRFESLPVATFSQRMGDLFGGGDRSSGERIAKDLQRIYSWYNTQSPSPFTVDMTAFLQRYPLPMLSVKDWAMQHRIFDQRPPAANRSKL